MFHFPAHQTTYRIGRIWLRPNQVMRKNTHTHKAGEAVVYPKKLLHTVANPARLLYHGCTSLGFTFNRLGPDYLCHRNSLRL